MLTPRFFFAVLLGGTCLLGTGLPLYAAEPSAIFVMNVVGSELRRVAQVENCRDHSSPRWSHDGSRLVFDVAPANGAHRRRYSVKVDGSELVQMGLGADADWSPDDKQLVFAVGENAPIKQGIWVQNSDGRGRQWLAAGASPRWSPDGSAISMVEGKSLLLLDMIQSQRRKLQDSPSAIDGYAWSPDGTKIAIVTAGDHDSKDLWIVDIANPAAKSKLLSGDLGNVVTWSPDTKLLAIVLDHQIQLLTTDGTGAPQAIPAQEGDNRMPAWSSDGHQIAFVSDRSSPAMTRIAPAQRRLRLEEVNSYSPGTVVYGIALSPDGRKAYIGLRKGLQIWDIPQNDFRTLDFLHGQLVSLSSDGRTLASSGVMIKIELADMQEGKAQGQLMCGGMCISSDFSDDGRRLVVSMQNGQAIVWDVASRKRLTVFKQHTKPVTRVAFLANGEEVASNGQDKTLRIWNAQTGEQRLEIPHPDSVWGLAVSPDNRLVATGTGGPTVGNPISQRIEKGNDNIVRLWDTASGKLVRELKGHTNTAFALSFSPDGRTLASGGWDRTLRLWDVESGQQVANLQRNGSVFAILFTPDGNQLLVAGGENRSADAPVQRFAEEQVKLYRITEADAPANAEP